MWKILGVVALVIFAIVVLPLAAIASLNTLFGLSIPANFDTWCSAVVLIMILQSSRK